MEQKKDSIINVSLSVCLALIISIITYSINQEITFTFFLETFILLAFFSIVTFCSKDRFNPFSFFLLSLFLGVLDIVFVVCNVRIVENKYDISIYEKSLWLIILWLFGFLIGYYIKISKKNKKSFKLLNIIDNYMKNANVNILLILGLLIQIWIIVAIGKTIIEVGGINAAMNNFSVFRYNNQGYLATILPLISIVTIGFLEKGNKKLAIISMIINFLLTTFTGRRGITINTVIIPFLIFYNYRIDKISNRKIVALGVPIIIFILFLGSMRNQQVTLGKTNNKVLNIAASITNTIQYGQNVPDLLYSMKNGNVDFQGGKYLFNGILGMIPRSVWKEKPELDHSLITSRLVYDEDITYGKPVGAFGFSYLCFGYIGVILSGIITGKVTSIIYNWIIKNKSAITILIYSITIQSFIVITNPEAQVKIITLTFVLIALGILSNLKQKNKSEGEYS